MASKYQLLADRLREELARNSGRPGYKLPTEQELSRQYHLSRQTVRHALALLAEEGLIQRRQGSGSYATGLLPGEAPRQIAVVTSFLDDYIFPAILHDASDVFSHHGYSTAVYATENRVSTEREILLSLLENPVSGLLVEGSKTALRDGGWSIQDRRFAWYDTEDRSHLLKEEDNRLLKEFLHKRLGGATAVICYNDEIAYHLIQTLLDAGHPVPEEVAVVSFDNSYLSQLGPVPVTSLRHRSHMGRVAAEQILALLDGGTARS